MNPEKAKKELEKYLPYPPTTANEARAVLSHIQKGLVTLPEDRASIIYGLLQDLTVLDMGKTEHRGDIKRHDRTFGQNLRKKTNRITTRVIK